MALPDITLGAASNLYIRMMNFKNVGDQEPGHTHTYDHFSVVSAGAVDIEVNGKTTNYKAPAMVFIRAEFVHKITAVEPNSQVLCVHALRGINSDDILDPGMIPAGSSARSLEVAAAVAQPVITS